MKEKKESQIAIANNINIVDDDRHHHTTIHTKHDEKHISIHFKFSLSLYIVNRIRLLKRMMKQFNEEKILI